MTMCEAQMPTSSAGVGNGHAGKTDIGENAVPAGDAPEPASPSRQAGKDHTSASAAPYPSTATNCKDVCFRRKSKSVPFRREKEAQLPSPRLRRARMDGIYGNPYLEQAKTDSRRSDRAGIQSPDLLLETSRFPSRRTTFRREGGTLVLLITSPHHALSHTSGSALPLLN